ncbi:MAG: C39 family peptidase [Mycobacteriales bacterium]
MFVVSRPLLVVAVLSAGLTLTSAAAPSAAANSPARPTSAGSSTAPVTHPDISFHRWSSARDFTQGSFQGTVLRRGALTFGTATSTVSYDDQGFGYPTRSYGAATWTSPDYRPGFGLTELVASWNAQTPAGTWLQVEMMGTTNAGTATKWYVMGRWASGDGDIHRTSLGGQGDSDGTIAIDTFFSRSGVSLTSYRLRVTLLRLPGTDTGPTLRSVGAVASALPDDSQVPTSRPGVAGGTELAVPRYSQDLHLGHYPQFNGGGEAWCSPTSTEMVVEYYRRYPPDVSWVQPQPHEDPSVDYAARYTYDYHYDGTGNWPFNTAYSGTYGLDAFVTQLRSLTEAERFVRAGIPLTVSVSFQASELDGAGYSTNGHLMNIIGFTRAGDVIANDPVSLDDPGVRRVYQRAQFENVWIPVTRSGGIAYVVHDARHPLPPNVRGLPRNW